MGKPGALRRLLRSCLLFSVHKHNKGEVEVNLESNPSDDGDSISLPEDIILDVLARLPVKILCQLRCVSKTWRALISDPAFVAAHRFRAAVAPLVMGVFGRPCLPDKPYDYDWLRPNWHELRVIDSADGSVLRVVNDVRSPRLMRSNLDLVLIDRGDLGASVIDPLSGKVAIIGGEPALKKYPMTDYSGTKLVIYTLFCSSTLGRASPSGAYNIVRLRDARSWSGDIQICEIATLGLGKNGIVRETTWRQRPEPPILTRRSLADSIAATADGILYFLDTGALTHRKGPGSPGWNRIASFDLESEEWKATINGPPIGYPNEDESWHIMIAVLRGSLCLVQTVGGLCGRYTNIWVLVDSEKSTWVKEYTIEMLDPWRFLNVLDILVDGRVLMLNTFKIEGEYRCILQLYYPRTGIYTNLMEMGEDFMGPLRLYTRNPLS